MAILFLDSPTSREADIKYTSVGANVMASIQSAVTPYGGDAYQMAANVNDVLAQSFAPVSSAMCSFLYRQSSAQAGINQRSAVFSGDSGSTNHVFFTTAGDGSINFRRGRGDLTIIASSPINTILNNVWYHIEIRVEISDTVGIIQCWVDGSLVVNASNVDTKNGGTNNTVDRIEMGRTQGATYEWADFVIHDGTTPIGVTRVIPLLPTADGAHTGFTPSTGTSHFAVVDETNPNDDTDYVSAATEGTKDSFAIADLPTGTWDVKAVQVSAAARRFDPGTKYLRPFVRTGAADFVGTSQVLSETYRAIRHIWEQNPNTVAAWTEGEVDGLEIGVEVRDS